MGDKAPSKTILDAAERIRRYDQLIQKQTGIAVRPLRFDGYVNLLNKYGTQKDTTENYRYDPEPAVADEMLSSIYEGNGLFARIIDAPAEEAMKLGFELDGIKDTNLIEFYETALDDLDWEEVGITAIKWARLFGGSIAVMLINDGQGVEAPLDWKNIKSIDGIRVYDRSVIQPDYDSMFSYSPEDPFRTRGNTIGVPEFYYINSKYGFFKVHESRCLIFKNGVLPENCSNSIYEIWGMPEYIRIKRAMRDCELAHGNGPKMLERAIQAVYKVKNLSELLQTDMGEDIVVKRLQTIDLARGLLNSIAIDSEGEEYDFRTFSFTGVSEIIDTTCNQLSALTSIPQTILFGRSPAGMNSTGESDMENWYSFVARIQKRMLSRNIRYLLSIIFQAGITTGEIDEVPPIKPKFRPLWSLSELEEAQLEQTKAATQQTRAATAQIYVGMQAVDPSEVRKGLSDSGEFDIETLLDDYSEEELFPELPEEQASSDEQEVQNGYPSEQNAETEQSTDQSAEDPSTQEMTQEDGVDSNNSVGVIVVSNGKILVGTRNNDIGKGELCGPGGHIERGETPVQAAIRETDEEFGIIPTELMPLGCGPFEPNTGLTPILFLCTKYEGTPKCDGFEITNPRFLSLAEIQEQGATLFKPFSDGLDVLMNSLNIAREDGGSGSGNFGHEGVPGEVGGSLPSGKALNDRVKEAFNFKANGKEYTEVGSEMRSILKDMPNGTKVEIKGTIYEKVGDNEFSYEWKAGQAATITLNGIANSVNAFDPSTMPHFEDISSDDVAAQKIESGELKPSETSAATVIKSIKSKNDLSNLSESDKKRLAEEVEAENPDYNLQRSGSRANEIAAQLDLNNPPTVMEARQFDNYVSENNCTKIWRGVQDFLDNDDGTLITSVGDIEKEFMEASSKDATYGGGNYGYGYHFATNQEMAQGFGKTTDDQNGTVFTCAIKPSAKIIDHEKAQNMAEKAGLETEEWALLSGYDGTKSETGVYNILNRGALVMKQPKANNDSLPPDENFFEKPIDKCSESAIVIVEGQQRADADKDDLNFITANGTHIPLIDGKAVGGPLQGEDFSKAKSENKTKSEDKPDGKASPKKTDNSKKTSNSPKRSEPKKESKKKGETESGSDNGQSKGTSSKPSPQGKNPKTTGFINKVELEDHFGRHGKALGCSSKEEYQERGVELLAKPCTNGIAGYALENGKVVRFNTKTGEYATGFPGQNLCTYMIPKDNKGVDPTKALEYYNKHRKEDGERYGFAKPKTK